jgi:hypothetical protein
MIKIAVSQSDYEKLKSDVLENKIIKRVEIPTSALKVDNLKVLKIGEHILELTNEAVRGLAYSLGISKSFIETIKGAYKENKEILNFIVSAVKSTKAKNIVLCYNSRMNQIVKVYPSGEKFISDLQYFEALESILAKTPKAYIRNINQSYNGDLTAIIMNPDFEFKFGNIADEVFIAGISLELIGNTMTSMFFNERLVCSNGMRSGKEKISSLSVDVGAKVPDFLNALMSKEYNIENITEFKRRVNRNYHTRASLAEVLQAESRLKSKIGNIFDTISTDMSFNFIKERFGEKYLLDRDIHKFLRTPLSVWELVNEITALSSKIEQQQLIVAEKTNLEIQIIGGSFMYKDPDLIPDNIKQIF